jgi:GTP-binding protein Era
MQARMREAALETARRMDLILHLHPAPEAPAPAFTQLTEGKVPSKIPVLTVYTKGDLVTAEESVRLEGDDRALVVSVTTAYGFDRLLARVRAQLPAAEFPYDPDDVGTQPLRFFVVEYLREAAFELLGDEIPYAFTAEVEEFREAARPVYIRVTLFVERESQKAIVIGRGGRTIKALGAHARARMEELVGAPVYLDCWVKALPHWRRDAAALTRFGFPEARNPDKESV